MAGGKGTRLREITNDEIPKPMAPVAGRPILEWQIEQFRNQGVAEIVLIVGYLGHKIREHFGDGSAFGVQISYIEESVPLGTAGSLSMLPPFLKGPSFFLAFGDVLFNIDLERMRRFHEDREATATLFAHPNAHPYDSDLLICESDGRVRSFDSKHNVRDYWYQNCVNAGIYLLDRSICAHVPENTKMDLEKDLLSGLIERGERVYAYQSPEYVKDVGTVDRIRSAETELKSGYAARRNLKNAQRAVFLDRDGTINRKNGLIFRDDQFELEACAAEAIKAINHSGYLAVVVTNQPVVARGLCGIRDVENIHRKMETLLGKEGAFLDAVYFCPHHPDKGYPEENPAYKIPCDCRKPGIKMLQDAAEQFNINLSQSWMIGDGTSDIQTGINAGTHTALVRTGDCGKDGKYNVTSDLVADDLLEAVREIIRRET